MSFDPEELERKLEVDARANFVKDNPGYLWVAQSAKVQHTYRAAARAAMLETTKRMHRDNEWILKETVDAHGRGSRDAINAGQWVLETGPRLAYLLGWYAGNNE